MGFFFPGFSYACLRLRPNMARLTFISFLRLTLRRYFWDIYTALQHTVPHLKPLYMLNSAERPNLKYWLLNSLTCSFAANYHLNFPSGLKLAAQLVVGSNPTGVRDFFSFYVWAYFISRKREEIEWNRNSSS